MANFFIARQPIFSQNKNVMAYELLYRSDEFANQYAESDNDMASMRVLTGSFLGTGIGTFTGGKPAFVNFTENLLLQRTATLFPNDKLFIEISEEIEPKTSVIQACRDLKGAGYKLALDGYKGKPRGSALENLMDIVKVDFQTCPHERRRLIPKSFASNHNAEFLAEKIETMEEYDQAQKMGYTLFQGFFFATPVTLSASTLPVSKMNVMLLMKEIVKDEPDIDMIRANIESDVGLAYEILKLVNSAYFAKRMSINSIRQAMAFLGLEGIKKWVLMSALRRQNETMNEVMEMSIIRSRFMEHIGTILNADNKSDEYALAGLFSLLHVLTDCPFYILLEHISVSDDVYAILAESRYDSQMGQTFQLILAYEKGRFDEAKEIALRLGLSMEQVEQMYLASLRWLYEYPARIKAIDE